MPVREKIAIRSVLEISILIALFSVLFNPSYLFHEQIKGDDASYVAHAFTLALDGDFNYSNEISFLQRGGKAEPERTTPPHPVGTGIVHAPIVKLFSMLDVMQDHPVLKDRSKYVGSWSFYGLFFSTGICFFLGLLFFFWAIETLTDSIPRWMILFFTMGYGVPYYIFQRFTMSHGPEFLLLSFIFWSSVKLMFAKGQQKHLLLMVLVAGIGLSYLIRPANVNVCLIPIMVWILLANFLGNRISVMQNRADWIYLLCAVLITTLFIISLNQKLYGVYLPDSEQMYGQRIRRIPATWSGKIQDFFQSLKYIPVLLFSSEFGLFFSAPVLVFGSAAAFFYGINRSYKLRTFLFLTCLVVYIGIPLAVVLFWKNTGDAYGYRYIFSVAPISILGMTILFSRNPGKQLAIPRMVFFVLTVYALLGQVFFASRDSLTPSAKVNAFGRVEKFSSNGYEVSLLRTITEPEGWANLLVKRLPGFVLVQVLDENYVRQIAQVKKLPATKFEEVVRNIKASSLTYRLMICLYGLLMPILIWYSVTRGPGRGSESAIVLKKIRSLIFHQRQ